MEIQIDWDPKLRAGLDPIPSVVIKPELIIFVFSGGPLDNLPAIETLKNLEELVEGILSAFTSLIASRA
jgi:hypothetical protein